MLLCSSLACTLLTGPYLAPAPTATLLPVASVTPTPPLAATNPSPVPSDPSSRTPTSPSVGAAPSLTPASALLDASSHDISLIPADLITHPDPALYSGDTVSFEVLVQNPSGESLQGLPVTIYRDTLGAESLASGQYARSGFSGREQATFYWAWDTAGLTGPQTVVVALDPSHNFLQADRDLTNNVITVTLDLLPAQARPQPEPEARWARAETDCCIFNYLTGTAAERDLERIEEVADAGVRDAKQQLGVSAPEKLEFTLLGRLLGHGGFAANTIAITYIDRDYAGGDLPQVFRHEATHVLDQQFAARKPALMGEGLAVFVAGGHFKVEDLEARAAALLALDRYIPLGELADNFYPSQHEIGYLEGGAFIHYLVQTRGWEAFKAFYASFPEAPSDSAMLDNALRLNFGQSLTEVESEWLDHLRALPPDPAQLADLRDTVAFYDTVRRYQQLVDPSAHYVTAWLPDVKQMRERGIVADYLRHPTAPENIAPETMMVEAASALAAGDFARAEWLIASVNSILGAGPLSAHARPGEGGFADPLAAQYLAVVHSAEAAGFEPQRIALNGTIARVVAIRDWPALAQLTFSQSGGIWALNSQLGG